MWEGAALLAALAVALSSEALLDKPFGPLALMAAVALPALLVWTAHRLPGTVPDRRRGHRESRPGVTTTRTATGTTSASPSIPRLYFTGAERFCQMPNCEIIQALYLACGGFTVESMNREYVHLPSAEEASERARWAVEQGETAELEELCAATEAEHEIQGFVNGFRMGVRLMVECATSAAGGDRA